MGVCAGGHQEEGCRQRPHVRAAERQVRPGRKGEGAERAPGQCAHAAGCEFPMEFSTCATHLPVSDSVPQQDLYTSLVDQRNQEVVVCALIEQKHQSITECQVQMNIALTVTVLPLVGTTAVLLDNSWHE